MPGMVLGTAPDRDKQQMASRKVLRMASHKVLRMAPHEALHTYYKASPFRMSRMDRKHTL